MTARYSIRHELEFTYESAVTGSVITLFLAPARNLRQLVRSFSLSTDPGGSIFTFTGPYGNRGHFFDRPSPHHKLHIRALSEVDVIPEPRLPESLGSLTWAALEAAIQAPEQWIMLQPSHFARPLSATLKRFMKEFRIEKGYTPLGSIQKLKAGLRSAFIYEPGSTTAQSPIDHILESRRGVCQDYAHVMISILRSWGIPSRYVSGYLGSDGSAGGRSESHAWVECWLPDAGWFGVDPVNDGDCDERHIQVAVGRDYSDFPPVRGIFSGMLDSKLVTHVEIARQKLD